MKGIFRFLFLCSLLFSLIFTSCDMLGGDVEDESGESSSEESSEEIKLVVEFNANGGQIKKTTQEFYGYWGTWLEKKKNKNSYTRKEGWIFDVYLEDSESLGLSNENGYIFKGWAVSSEDTNIQYKENIKYSLHRCGKIVLYAVWAYDVTYTLTFDANGGTLGSEIIQTVSGEAIQGKHSLKLNSSETLKIDRDGYEFKGWSTSSVADAVEYDDEADICISSDITLYAVWAEIKTYTITYNANGGYFFFAGATSTTEEAFQLITGANLDGGVSSNLNLSYKFNLHRQGYRFVCWVNSIDSDSARHYFPSASDDSQSCYTFHSDITLYALWEEDDSISYTITFNPNGGEIQQTSQTIRGTKKNGVEGVILGENVLGIRHSEYIFLGWSTSPLASYAMYRCGQKITLTNDITLYAIWGIQSSSSTTKSLSVSASKCVRYNRYAYCELNLQNISNVKSYKIYRYAKSTMDFSSTNDKSKYSYIGSTTYTKYIDDGVCNNYFYRNEISGGVYYYNMYYYVEAEDSKGNKYESAIIMAN